MVGVSASVNLPLHHKVQKFSSGTGLPGWSRKKGCKTVVMWWRLYKTTCIMRHPHLITGGFCWSNVLLTACPCWPQLVHWDWGKDASVLIDVTCTVSVPCPLLFQNKWWMKLWRDWLTLVHLKNSQSHHSPCLDTSTSCRVGNGSLKDDMQRFFTKLMQKSFLAAYCNINPSV